jgi:putative FmdB family regulatory protein
MTMPIYEYECRHCGHEFEEMQRITADPLTECPACGEPQAHRIISRTNFVLKGSGWYVTDYGRGTGGAAGEQKKSKPSKTEAKPESESKPKAETPKPSTSKSDD